MSMPSFFWDGEEDDDEGVEAEGKFRKRSSSALSLSSSSGLLLLLLLSLLVAAVWNSRSRLPGTGVPPSWGYRPDNDLAGLQAQADVLLLAEKITNMVVQPITSRKIQPKPSGAESSGDILPSSGKKWSLKPVAVVVVFVVVEKGECASYVLGQSGYHPPPIEQRVVVVAAV